MPTLVLAELLDAKFKTPGGFDWGWTDWLGAVLVLLAVTFFLAVIVALWRGESALKVLDRIGRVLTAGIRQKSD
jgi:hypothetical protein